ncbi:MAG: hypothetical protein FJ098_09830 [Deltaproteobacteria bacterium]|nr:hypothetical protein [Deltaproteobacteria bacterium]
MKRIGWVLGLAMAVVLVAGLQTRVEASVGNAAAVQSVPLPGDCGCGGAGNCPCTEDGGECKCAKDGDCGCGGAGNCPCTEDGGECTCANAGGCGCGGAGTDDCPCKKAAGSCGCGGAGTDDCPCKKAAGSCGCGGAH